MGNQLSKYQVETNIDAGADKWKETKTPGKMMPIRPPWNNSTKIAHPNTKRIQPAGDQSGKKDTADGHEVDERPPWNYSTRVDGHKSQFAIKPIAGKKVDYSHVDKIVDDVMPDNILNQIRPIFSLKLKNIPEKDLSQTHSVVDDWMPNEIIDQIRPINSLKVKTYPKEDLSNIDPVVDDRMSDEQLAKIRPIRFSKKNAKKSEIPAKEQPLIAETGQALDETYQPESDKIAKPVADKTRETVAEMIIRTTAKFKKNEKDNTDDSATQSQEENNSPSTDASNQQN